MSSPEQLPSMSQPEINQDLVQNYLERQKDPNISAEDVQKTIEVIHLLNGKFSNAVEQHEQEYDRDRVPRYLLQTLDEAHGNFNGIFPEQKISWHNFIKGLANVEKSVEIKHIDPLEYYSDIGNGMDAAETKKSVEKTVKELYERDPRLGEEYASKDPSRIAHAASTIVKTDLFYQFMDKESIDRAKRVRGYDHVESTLRQLKSLTDGNELTPTFIGKFSEAPAKFEGKPKVVLDGTHRALVSAIARRKQYVFEVDMGAIIQHSSPESREKARATLVEPDVKYKDSYLEAARELLNTPEWPEDLTIEHLEQNFEKYVNGLKRAANPNTRPEGRAPQNTFWLMEGVTFIGDIQIRHHIDGQEEKGHIGYEIRPSKRGQGYGYSMLAQALEKSKTLGLKQVVLITGEKNHASRAIIEKNNGKLKDTLSVKGKDEKICKYIIELE